MVSVKRVLAVLVFALGVLGWAVVPAFASPHAEGQFVYSRGVVPVGGATGGDSTAVSDADAESTASAESDTLAAADSGSGDADGGDAIAANTAESGSIHDNIIVAPITCVAVYAEAHCSVHISPSTGDVHAHQDAEADGGDGGHTGDTGDAHAHADSHTSAESDDASAHSGDAHAGEGGDAADADADDGSRASSDA